MRSVRLPNWFLNLVALTIMGASVLLVPAYFTWIAMTVPTAQTVSKARPRAVATDADVTNSERMMMDVVYEFNRPLWIRLKAGFNG